MGAAGGRAVETGLDAAFCGLMAGYCEALGCAEREQRSATGEIPEPRRQSRGIRLNETVFAGPLLRLLVGSHVRSRLGALIARFSQIEPTLAGEASGELREWYSTRRELMEGMAAPLPSLRLPGVFVVVPFLVTFATAIGKIPPLPWAIVFGVCSFPALVAAAALVHAYRRKRELFLDQAGAVDRRSAEGQRVHDGRNLYRAEEGVFSLLGSRRRPEMELDRATIEGAVFLLAEASLAAALVVPSAQTWLGFAGCGLLMANAVIDWRLPKRIWR